MNFRDENPLLGAISLEDGWRLQPYLQPSERILWAGRPDVRVTLLRREYLFTPFAIFWLVLSIVVFVLTLNLGESSSQSEAGRLFAIIVAGVFIIFGLYLMIGRLLYKWWWATHTIYGVTEFELMVLTGERFRSLGLDQVDKLYLRDDSDGNGSIAFERLDGMWGYSYWTSADAGMSLIYSRLYRNPLTFRNVEEYEALANLIDGQLRLLADDGTDSKT